MLNVTMISVQNDESLHGHCTNERRVERVESFTTMFLFTSLATFAEGRIV